jgi:hypothetical protein
MRSSAGLTACTTLRCLPLCSAFVFRLACREVVDIRQRPSLTSLSSSRLKERPVNFVGIGPRGRSASFLTLAPWSARGLRIGTEAATDARRRRAEGSNRGAPKPPPGPRTAEPAPGRGPLNPPGRGGPPGPDLHARAPSLTARAAVERHPVELSGSPVRRARDPDTHEGEAAHPSFSRSTGSTTWDGGATVPKYVRRSTSVVAHERFPTNNRTANQCSSGGEASRRINEGRRESSNRRNTLAADLRPENLTRSQPSWQVTCESRHIVGANGGCVNLRRAWPAAGLVLAALLIKVPGHAASRGLLRLDVRDSASGSPISRRTSSRGVPRSAPALGWRRLTLKITCGMGRQARGDSGSYPADCSSSA